MVLSEGFGASMKRLQCLIPGFEWMAIYKGMLTGAVAVAVDMLVEWC